MSAPRIPAELHDVERLPPDAEVEVLLHPLTRPWEPPMHEVVELRFARELVAMMEQIRTLKRRLARTQELLPVVAGAGVSIGANFGEGLVAFWLFVFSAGWTWPVLALVCYRDWVQSRQERFR